MFNWLKKLFQSSSYQLKKPTPNSRSVQQESAPSELVEGQDYYIENGLYVFTAYYLKQKGYCCESGCRHCPYNK